MTGTAPRRRSKLNHSRINRRSVDWPISVSAVGRVISSVDMSSLDHRELHIGRVEAATFRHHAQDALPGARATFPKKFIEHDENRSGAGVPARVEVRKPSFLRDARAAHLEHVRDPSAEGSRTCSRCAARASRRNDGLRTSTRAGTRAPLRFSSCSMNFFGKVARAPGSASCAWCRKVAASTRPICNSRWSRDDMSTDEITRPTALTEIGQSTLRRLMREWFNFERLLGAVPVIRRLDLGTFTRADYQRLLLNLRPQVVEGSRWISRCASSFDRDHADIRSVILRHAHDEHRDYEVLEQDFVATGGDLAAIRAH